MSTRAVPLLLAALAACATTETYDPSIDDGWFARAPATRAEFAPRSEPAPFLAETAPTESYNGTVEHEEEKRHLVGVFVGLTTESFDDTAVTLGVDYEYRYNDVWGFGGFVDYAGGNVRSVALGGAAYIHPWKEEGPIFVVGPGADLSGGDAAALLRLGVLTEYPQKNFKLLPSLYLDLIRHEKPLLVLGLTFAFDF